MATAFYRARFEKQLTGSGIGGINCAGASGAMLADQATLGLKDPSPEAFRRHSGDYSGGLLIGQVGHVLEAHYGVGVTVYDASDGYTFDRLVADLKRGKFAVVNGDYDVVPNSLSGQPSFNGLHAEFWHQWTPTGIIVGDPLCDGRMLSTGRRAPKGYVKYPLNVAREYVNKYDREVPGHGIHACVMDLKRLKARPVTPYTNIRATATVNGTVIGKFGGSQTVVWGGTVVGEKIGNNGIWYRVWCSSASRIGYCHSSVVARI